MSNSPYTDIQRANLEAVEIARMEQHQNAIDMKPIDVNRPFRLGIMVNEANYEDILYYNAQFREINRLFGYKINLIFIGYKPENDKMNALEGVDFDYVPPTSIVHYFKQLKALDIDLMFIPLINEPNSQMLLYNSTSDDTKKWQEAALYKIPLLVCDIYPYNAGLIKLDWDGFIYQDRNEFMKFFVDLFENKFSSIKAAGHYAHERARQFYYSKETGELLMKVFIMDGLGV